MVTMATISDERSSLLGSPTPSSSTRRLGTRRLVVLSSLAIAVGALFLSAAAPRSQSSRGYLTANVPLLGKSKKSKSKTVKKSKTLSEIDWPDPFARCEYVEDVMLDYVHGDDQEASFKAQAQDPSVFYRATARIFWRDFGSNSYENQTTHWTENDFQSYWIQDLQIEGTNVSLKSLWTWVTGDQHLSNFGAWRNRHGDIVFGVNDFDEGAIYDFQIDLLRVAVSIANHAISNSFDYFYAEKFVNHFMKSYVKAVTSYVGNEDAALFELTPKTAKGKLQKFLKKVEKGKDSKLIQKFTEVVDGRRQFIKGPSVGVPHNETRLAPVEAGIAQEIQNAISPTNYGATRMKLGWNVHEWDNEFFKVRDIAGRVGSGIGSYGVDRFYVLLKGKDTLLEEDVDGAAVILDVKYQPPAAVHDVLSVEDEAWYSHMFANDAARVVAAQSRLTSYTDPFLGWFLLPAKDGNGERPFSVRQRSPWKDDFNIDKLTKWEDFREYVQQIALATATAHTRGTVAKAPADFKHVVASVLGDYSIRKQWMRFMTGLAMSYRQQVLMDYSCFKSYVESTYGKF